METPVQHQNTIQTRATTIHLRLAIRLFMCITINVVEIYMDIPDGMTKEEGKGKGINLI